MHVGTSVRIKRIDLLYLYEEAPVFLVLKQFYILVWASAWWWLGKKIVLFLYFQRFTSQNKKNLILLNEIIPDLHRCMTEITVTALRGWFWGFSLGKSIFHNETLEDLMRKGYLKVSFAKETTVTTMTTEITKERVSPNLIATNLAAKLDELADL